MDKVKILLVEDDSFLREIIFMKLEKEGFAVREAEDGEKAIAAVSSEKYDIILLDLIMPAVDGFEVLERIRSSEEGKNSKTPIIVLSNLGEEDNVKKALDLGANDYMVKAHFTTDEVIEKIKAELEK
jgi:DNA-binding response OmpR family regulator